MDNTLFEYTIKRFNDKEIRRIVVCPSALVDARECLGKYGLSLVETIDERSAGYIATGMSYEANEPVIVICSANSSFRNLTSAMTEAYYRKLPVLVLTIDNSPETVDQSVNPQDIYAFRYIVSNGDRNKVIDDILDNVNADLNRNKPVLLELLGYDKRINDINATADINECEVSTIFSDVEINKILDIIPSDACIHLGSKISEAQKQLITTKITEVYCNDGANASDGKVATLIGSSVVAKNQLHVGLFNEGECIYDLNMLGNRHIANNITIFVKEKSERCYTLLKYAESLDWNVISFENVKEVSFDKLLKPLMVKIN